MKKNQFNISETMAAVKAELPEFTWDDIIRCGYHFVGLLQVKITLVNINGYIGYLK